VMAGGNRTVEPYRTNQPDVLCISMTDAAENMQSLAGVQVDFAAPGWGIYSTTINGGYAMASGTSYSAPLFCGVVAALFSMNPLLGPDEVVEIMKRTAVDKGPPGWDQWFGWGRIDFAAAAAEAHGLLPRLELTGFAGSRPLFRTHYQSGNEYSLWRATAPPTANWILVSDPFVSTNGNTLHLQDAEPPPTQAFYQLGVSRP